MNEYHFFYDQGGIAGVYHRDKKIKTFTDFDEICNILAKIGLDNYNNIKLGKNSITLKNGRRIITLDDVDLLHEDGFLYYFKKSLPKILSAIHRRQTNKHKGKNITTKKGVFLATTGTIVMLSLGGAFLGNTKKPPKDIEIKIESLDDVDNEIYIDIEHEPTEERYDLNRIDDYQNMMTELDNGVKVARLAFDDDIDLEKQQYAYDNYYEIVNKYANKWGVSPNLPMSVLTQESGGYETNLMQIQFDSWLDMPITGYNYTDGKYETIVLTDKPETYKNKGYKCISRTEIKNPITNISVGTLLLEYSIKHMNYHIGAGIQCYNFGIGNMNKLLEETTKQTGMTGDEILSDQSNTSFMDYTDIISVGDANYLPNVVRYNLEGEYSINELLENGEIVTHSVQITNSISK